MRRQLLILASLLGCTTLAHAQDCLPQGITLNQQWEVNAFPNNHPGCTHIQGFLKIGLSNNITDLTPLSQLTSVGGYLFIEWNPELQTLAGLNDLTSIGGYLRIENSNALSDITALANLTTVGGYLEIRQTGIESLVGLGSLTSIGGNLIITQSAELTDLQGLESLLDIGGGLSIENNIGLGSLNGLAPVNALGGAFWVKGNPLLTDLSAASGLTSVGTHLNLQDNASLASVEELSGIATLGGYLRVEGLPLLTNLTPLAGIDPGSMSHLVLQDLPGVSDCALANFCAYLTLPGAQPTIANNAAGCASVAEVEAACSSTSVHDQGPSSDPSIEVFPNPSSGSFQVKAEVQGAVRLKVFDVAGRMVHQESTTASAGWTHTLHLGHLVAGGYLLRIHGDQGISTARLHLE